ncbi:hypothetical protein AAIH32_19015 [Pseudarthrobacter oxydans]|uniref:hypothetical protein n=1 Tax=Pseudarthrobacter oxydans TaxID=1671 RepID=UPI003D29590C
MENPDTLILNLTFLGTVGMAFLMFLLLFLLGVITLVLAGIGRLAAVTLMALFGRRSRSESVTLVRLGGPFRTGPDGGASVSAAGPAGGGVPAKSPKAKRQRRDWRSALKPAHVRSALRTAVVRHPALTAARREPPVLAEDWASAVAEADARAMARARAAAPEIKLSVRDLPDPRVPADKVVEVAPLVESALDTHGPGRVPRSFKKTQAPRPLSPLDTGSLVSLSGPAQAVKGTSSKNSTAKGTGVDRQASTGNPHKGRQPLP